MVDPVNLCIISTVYDLTHRAECALPLEDPVFLYDYLQEFERTVVPEYLYDDGSVD